MAVDTVVAGVAPPVGDVTLRPLFSGQIVLWTESSLVAELAGVLDAAAAADARRFLAEVIAAGAEHVELDLRRLSFVDAAGLGVLVAAARRARDAGLQVRATGAGRAVARVLRLTGVDRAIGLGDAWSEPAVA